MKVVREEVKDNGEIIIAISPGNKSFFDMYYIEKVRLCNSGELEIELFPIAKTETPDSFANQVAQEVEEFEQLALDI